MDELRLPRKFKNILADYTKKLKDIYRDGLISIILYGSAASGEFSKAHSNINLAVILNDASLGNLSKTSKIINDKRYRLFNPVFFTEDYIKSSKDVFPIEFLDMKENHNVLYGKDVLKGLDIDIRNLRFQCEQELKAKLLNIKRVYLRNKEKRALTNLLFKSFTSALHILRNLVRLKGLSPSYLKEDILKEIEREFQIDTAALNKILIAKRQSLRLTYGEIESLFFDFVEKLEEIAGMVDRL